MTGHAGRKHAVYAASASDRWLRCTGSIAYTAGLPEGMASSYALDGTEAHELLEFALTNGYRSAFVAHSAMQPQWTYRHDNEDARLESLQEGLDHLWDLIDAYGEGASVWLECQFKFPSTESDDVGGTTDVAIYIQDFDMLIVADYKHGAGTWVDAVENTQMMTYATSVRASLRAEGLPLYGQTAYRLVIIQPRAFSKSGTIREWVTDDNRLDHFMGEVDIAIRKSRSPTPELVPGKYCRWCPAYSTCPAAETARIGSVPLPQFKSIETLRKEGLPEPKDLDLNRLAAILEAEKMIDEWFKVVRQHALALAKEGVNIPGFKLVETQAKSKWYGEPRAVAVGLAHIVSYPDPDVFMPQTLVTITEAKQFIKEQIYARVGKGQQSKKLVEEANKAIATLTTRESSGNLTLVPLDDNRPAILNPSRITFNPPEGAT